MEESHRVVPAARRCGWSVGRAGDVSSGHRRRRTTPKNHSRIKQRRKIAISARVSVIRLGFLGLFSLRSMALSLPDFPPIRQRDPKPRVRSMPDGHGITAWL